MGVLARAQHHHEVGHHCRLALVVKRYKPRFAEFRKSELHHADRAFHDGGARVDYRLCLLALEHGGGDLLRVGEVRYARFHDLYAGDLDSLLQVVAEGGGYLLRTAAQRLLVVLGGVVGVLPRYVSYCRVALYGDEVHVIVDIEHRFRRVAYAPYHDDADLDGIAVRVVDFLLLVVERHRLH